MRKPRVAITVGDPAGIGPEVAARAAADRSVLEVCEPVLYTPPAGAVFAPGVLSADAGRAAYDLLVRAAGDAQRGVVDAVATAPINKEAFRLAGLPWSGHTDLLAHLTGASHVAMMFYSDALRVVLATVHIALAEVPRALTQASLESTIALTARELPRFDVPAPRIGVAGLNPHAGEHGLFGGEEDRVIRPAIAACRAKGIDVSGPFSGRYDFRARHSRRIRRRRRLLSRSRADSGEACRVRPGREPHARSADRADLGRSRHGVRYCRPGRGRSGQYDCGGAVGGTAITHDHRRGRRDRRE